MTSLSADAGWVVGPTGTRLTLADLPAPTPGRWVARRKAEVVAAVDGGLLTEAEACARYSVSAEEFESWRRGLAGGGLRGLYVSRPKGRRSR